MARVTFKGSELETVGELPGINSSAPSFQLTKTDLAVARLEDFAGQRIVMNIFPSIDTPVCASSVRRFNKEAGEMENTVVLCISADLPFAHSRFCEVEGLKDVIPLSVFRSPEFGQDYGLTFKDCPLEGLLARTVLVVNEAGKIVYSQLVDDIGHEPDYEAVLKFLASQPEIA